MLRYQKGYICNGYTFVVNKEDVHNATDDMFVNATALLPDGWISVEERLPEAETEVLIVAVRNGHKKITTAGYEEGTVSTEDSAWYWQDYDFDYDEDTDRFLIPQGWWEYRHYNPDDVFNNCVDDVVTHWMPLPEPPKEDTNESH